MACLHEHNAHSQQTSWLLGMAFHLACAMRTPNQHHISDRHHTLSDYFLQGNGAYHVFSAVCSPQVQAKKY